MENDKIHKLLEDHLKPQREINNFIIVILAAMIPTILTAADKLTLEVALLFEIPILIVYISWSFINSSKKRSNIDWNKFYNMLVIEKARLGILPDSVYNQVFNNYITFLYLTALYEGKDKFAEEIWDKARIK